MNYENLFLQKKEEKENREMEIEKIIAQKEKHNEIVMNKLFDKIKFLNNHGFDFYLNREYETGWRASTTCRYHWYIRSKKLIGYICGYNVDNQKINTTFFTGSIIPRMMSIEDFVKKAASC